MSTLILIAIIYLIYTSTKESREITSIKDLWKYDPNRQVKRKVRINQGGVSPKQKVRRSNQ